MASKCVARRPSENKNESDGGEVSRELPDPSIRGATQAKPLAVGEATLEKLQRFAGEPQWRQEGFASALITSTEEQLVCCAPQLFGIVIQEVSGDILSW